MKSNRPNIVCHMMSTIEGKITSADSTDILSDKYFELYTKTEEMLEKQAWMLGRVTMQMFASTKSFELPKSDQNIDITDYLSPQNGKLFLFGLDTKGVLRWDKNTVKFSNIEEPLNLIVVVVASTPKEYLHYLRENNISYIVAGKNEINFKKLFEKIKDKFGVENLLLEGGGLINGSVMAEGLVDEISLLITPTVVNQSKAPSSFERIQDEPLNLQHYKLNSVTQLENGTVWLRYEKLPQA